MQGGGCSGFQYALGFDRGPQDGDNEVEMNGVRVVIDPLSAPYLAGSEIDYVDALMGAGFAINNPNVTAACGCVLPGEGRSRCRPPPRAAAALAAATSARLA